MKNKELTKEECIVQYLKDNGQKANWLALKIGLTPTHLHFVLKGNKKTKRVLNAKNLEKINEVLKTNF